MGESTAETSRNPTSMALVVRWTGVVVAALALGLAIMQPGAHALKAGDVAPPMRLATLDGQPVDLSPFRGRPMFLNFFATWCGPCKMEIPELNRAHDAMGAQVPVVGVLVLSGLPPAVKSEVTPMGIRYPVWVTDDETAEAWHISAVPVTVLVDAQGRIAWVSNGTVDEDELRAATRHVGASVGAAHAPPSPLANAAPVR